jgi:ubiquinone/menaquinone biosynthesis C-methylase UbiE
MNYYDEISAGYNELHKEEQLKKIMRIMDGLNVQKEDRLLDVGCGTAFSFDVFSAINCRFQGVEPSKGLIEQSLYKDKITNCKAEELPFPDNLFTVVVSVTCLQNFDNPLAGLEEMKRVCSDRLAISFLKNSPRRAEFEGLLKDVFTVNHVVEEDKDLIFFCQVQ